MENSRVSHQPSWLRRFIRRRKAIVIGGPLVAVAITISMVGTAAAQGGVSTACIPNVVASDQKGGWVPITSGPNTRTYQRSQAGSRAVDVWRGVDQVCPTGASQDCKFTYRYNEAKSYSKVISLSGGFGPGGGGQPLPIPFPIFSVDGSVVNQTETTSRQQDLEISVKPGQRATPKVAVDYVQWSGDLVGAYHYSAPSGPDCQLYYLSPNEKFGTWSAEVAGTEYATWDIH
jgi:hypothetical protein